MANVCSFWFSENYRSSRAGPYGIGAQVSHGVFDGHRVFLCSLSPQPDIFEEEEEARESGEMQLEVGLANRIAESKQGHVESQDESKPKRTPWFWVCACDSLLLARHAVTSMHPAYNAVGHQQIPRGKIHGIKLGSHSAHPITSVAAEVLGA